MKSIITLNVRLVLSRRFVAQDQGPEIHHKQTPTKATSWDRGCVAVQCEAARVTDSVS